MKFRPNRSQSFDKTLLVVHENLQRKSPQINREWSCQICRQLNQLCSHCGSTQINIYIPTMNSSRQDITNGNNNEENKHRRSVLITHKRKTDENLVLKHVEELREKLSISHSLFSDKTFPASNQSLYINGQSFSKSTLDLLPDQQQTHFLSNHSIQWLRPNQINPPSWNDNLRTQWTVYRNPKPNDVLQGALGDCWFITALSVLAEQPEYLMKVNHRVDFCSRSMELN